MPSVTRPKIPSYPQLGPKPLGISMEAVKKEFTRQRIAPAAPSTLPKAVSSQLPDGEVAVFKYNMAGKPVYVAAFERGECEVFSAAGKKLGKFKVSDRVPALSMAAVKQEFTRKRIAPAAPSTLPRALSNQLPVGEVAVFKCNVAGKPVYVAAFERGECEVFSAAGKKLGKFKI